MKDSAVKRKALSGLETFLLTTILSTKDLKMDRSQNYALHFICITFHLHYITFAFKNHDTSARNA